MPSYPGPPSLPLPGPKSPCRGSFLPTAPWPLSSCDEGLGQEAEDRKQQKQEGGQEEADETPASSHSAPPTFRTAKQHFQKYLLESKLMRYYISSDNGRMWGRVLQGRRSTQSAPGAAQGAWAGAGGGQPCRGNPSPPASGSSVCPLSLREGVLLLHSQNASVQHRNHYFIPKATLGPPAYLS